MNKKRFYRTINYLLLFIPLFLLGSCNDEDNIQQIFIGKRWYLGNFHEPKNKNWIKDNDETLVYRGEDLTIINGYGRDRFYIDFTREGFTAKAINTSFSGTWEADPKSKRLTMHIIAGESPSSDGSRESVIARDFFNSIKRMGEGGYYMGEEIYLKIVDPEENRYMYMYKNRSN